MKFLTKVYINTLLNRWTYGEEHKNECFDLFLEFIDNQTKAEDWEKEYIIKILSLSNKKDLLNLSIKEIDEIVYGKYSIDDVINKIKYLVSIGDFIKSDELYNQIKIIFPNELLPYKYENIKKDFQRKILNNLNILLETYKFGKSDSLYTKYQKVLKTCDYENIKNKYINKKRKEEILIQLDSLIKKNCYSESDDLFKDNNDLLSREEYEKIKIEYIQSDLKDLATKIKLKYPFDDEKANVLATTGQNILVQARAGSGKTSAIALKVRQLINNYKIKPEEMLVLAFNKNAADEFQKRINEFCQREVATRDNTLTFHALAWRIVNTSKQLLKDKSIIIDDKYHRNNGQQQFQKDFIRQCFNDVDKKEKEILEKLYYSFLRTVSEKTRIVFKNDKEYYLYLRNLKQESISGHTVNSKGEKYIADFLFEHKISINGKELNYIYERNIKKNINSKRTYCPDFSLYFIDDNKKENLQAVIEYFGFTKKNNGYPKYFDTMRESQDYIQESILKKEKFQDTKISFIEISIDDFENNSSDEDLIRQRFEDCLEQKLTNIGVEISPKLSIEDVLKKIPKDKTDNRKNKLIKQICQFINKAKKLSYSPNKIKDIAELEKKDGNLSQRNEYFVKIARRVYSEYVVKMNEGEYTDFDDIFVEATEKIKQEGLETNIISKYKENKIGVIKYILIDEYQDFSLLFYKLINTIRSVNQKVKIFCVGDDWQAINGFAGSDLEYFNNFEKYFSPSVRISLLVNHRSCENIVKYSNLVMFRLGNGGIPKDGAQIGEIHLCQLPYVEWQDISSKDNIYHTRVNSLGCWENRQLEVSRYLKIIEKIIKDNTNKEICLLFRTNTFYGVYISLLKSKFKEWYPHNLKIVCSTAHRYKGRESDVVVIVDANRGNYPKIHPDNELMEIFGVTLSKVIEEEQRLFYVATSRSKEKLYMIYDKDVGCSDFIPMNWSKYNNIPNN